MNKTELDDLVPPEDDCRAAYEAGVIGDTTVLVWRNRTGKMSSDCRVKMREPEDISYQCDGVSVKFYPAPTLAELLAMLPAAIYGKGVFEFMLDDREENTEGRYDLCYNRYQCGGELEETTMIESDTNPAAAALRLLVRVKQGDRK